MSAQIRHFLLTQDGGIREFTAEEAALIATGANRLPEYADRRVRYLQVSWESQADDELKIQTAGAAIRFDHDGKLTEAIPPNDSDQISRFEHDTCVQWALRKVSVVQPVVH